MTRTSQGKAAVKPKPASKRVAKVASPQPAPDSEPEDISDTSSSSLSSGFLTNNSSRERRAPPVSLQPAARRSDPPPVGPAPPPPAPAPPPPAPAPSSPKKTIAPPIARTAPRKIFQTKKFDKIPRNTKTPKSPAEGTPGRK